MRIALVDVDGHNFPNLPLMKLSAYHKDRGDQVEWWEGFAGRYDIAYISKVFDFTPDFLYPTNADAEQRGGTGYGSAGTLPEEVEHIMPDYSIYPKFPEAYGFLTRGCPRHCPFCIVSEKEGPASKKVADLKEFWSGQKEIKLLDPNLLACEQHEELLQQLIASGAWVDFTQGLDIRFVNEDNAALLNRVKIKYLHFAWDNPKQDLEKEFERFKRLSGLNERKMMVYVLTNYNSTLEEDLHRIYTLRRLGYSPFVMVYNKDRAPQEKRDVQRWVNNRRIWRNVERFEDYRNGRFAKC